MSGNQGACKQRKRSKSINLESNRKAQKKHREKTSKGLETLKDTIARLERSVENINQQKHELEEEVKDLKEEFEGTQSFTCSLLPHCEKVEPPFVPAVSWKGFNPASEAGITLQLIFKEPLRLTKGHASKLSEEEFWDVHEQFLLQAGALMKDNISQNKTSPAGLKLKALVDERNGFACYVAYWLPFSFLRLKVPRKLDRLRNHRAPDYKQIFGSLQQTDKQKQKLQEALSEYIRSTKCASLQLDSLKKELLEPVKYGVHPSELDLRFHLNVRKLRELLDSLHVQLDFFQEAKLLLESWPYIPDPEEVHAQLGVQNCELSSQPPIMKQELEEIEDTPYAGVTCKMMSEFRRMGICGTSTGVESSPAVLVDQHP